MPIINPIYFYLIDVCNKMAIVSVFVTLVLICCGICFLCYASGACITDEEEKKFKNLGKLSMKLALLFALLVIFIPNKETLYQMLIFDNLTIENLNIGTDYIKSLIDYIFVKVGGQ